MKSKDVHPVLIAGAGPVGLTLAIDLARRGITSLIVEPRAAGVPPSVKRNHVSSRTMESFRRLGIAEEVRNSGLPADYPQDAVYRTVLADGDEITRIAIPSRAERDTDFDGADTWWPTAEPPHRINQIYLEPILFRRAESFPEIEILCEHEFVSATQDDEGVTATIRRLADGETTEVRSRYLIGCDGGRSTTRKLIGAALEGDPVIQRVQSTYIRAPQLLDLIPGRKGWMNLSLNPRRCGNVIAIDGKENWLIHCYLYEHEDSFDGLDRDAEIRAILGVDDSFEYEVLSEEDWIGRRLVADRFRDGRIFLCGDSAHLWVPYAGYGMNAGVADALNLSWLLAGALQGWGGDALLDAYQAERKPITDQVSHFAMNHALAALRHRRDVPANIMAPGAEGEAIRADFGQEVFDLNVAQYCCGGLNFGYFYDGSPVIAYDGEAAPAYSMNGFEQSDVPGCRTPHFWRASGRSVYDQMGLGFTLLRFDPQIDVSSLLDAANAAGLPLTLLDIRPQEKPAACNASLLISRPDFHVGWRGDRIPDQPAALVDLLRGEARQQPSGPATGARA